MTYEQIIQIATKILIASGIISLVVSLITQYFIKILFPKLTTKVLNYIIVGLSEAFTIAVGVIYIQTQTLNPAWYVYVGIVFLGLLVAMVSMNGYDKIYSFVYEWINNLFKKDK